MYLNYFCVILCVYMQTTTIIGIHGYEAYQHSFLEEFSYQFLRAIALHKSFYSL